MQILNKEIDRKWVVIGGLILVGLVIFIIMSIPKSKPPNPIPVINNTQVQLQKQYEFQLKAKDTIIRDYQSRLNVSQEKYTVLANRYIQLQKEKENVKPLVTNQELRDSFTVLGFAPLPAK